jgi:hypothetical protein
MTHFSLRFFSALAIFIASLTPISCFALDHTLRDYNQRVVGGDREDLRYIVITLGRYNQLKIGLESSNLKAAGNRIRHLHPLRFLETVFTDEELKVAIRSIPGKTFVDKHFFDPKDGLIGSLDSEYAKGNMPPAFIQDFAKNININVKEIDGLIQQRKWREFIMKLITIVPRKGDVRRYNM